MKFWAYVSLFAGIGFAAAHHWAFWIGVGFFVFFLSIPEERWRAEQAALHREKQRYEGVPLGHPPRER